MGVFKFIGAVLLVAAACLAIIGCWGLLAEPGRHIFGEITNFVCIAMLIAAAILVIAAGFVSTRGRPE